MILLRFGVARQDHMASIGSRQMNVDHLNGGHLLDDRAWGQSWSEGSGMLFQCHL